MSQVIPSPEAEAGSGALAISDGGRFLEGEPPARLPDEAVTVLDGYGSRFFAGARTLREALPDPAGSVRPVVVLRMRGRTRVGATLVEVLDDYANALADVDGRIYFSGVDADVAVQRRRADKLDLDRTVHLAPEADVLGASTEHAFADASA